jgi:SAM-dependent methyltransferase
MNKPSTSEDHGIGHLTQDDRNVYSVGISTGGVAEIRMAESDPERHIVATSVDAQGIELTKKYIADSHLETRIDVKIEDISEPLPYTDGHFDYIYARLVLHYLSEEKLRSALKELHRILKSGGKLFVVVRSVNCPDATRPEVQYDLVTKLTSGSFTDEETGKLYTYSRYFHTEDSIGGYVTKAGFTLDYIKMYDEYLYKDFMHTDISPRTDNVIELLATKKHG